MGSARLQVEAARHARRLAVVKHEPQDMVAVGDYERAAPESLERLAHDYYRSGSGDERTLAANREAWARWIVHYRVLVDVAKRDLSTTILGSRWSMPTMVAPAALQRMAHPDGELATARAAKAAGVPMGISSLSTTSVEEICAVGGECWLQLYVGQDRGFVREFVQRSVRAGCRAIALTVDAPVWGTRERDVRNHFHVPAHLSVVNLVRPGGPTGHTGRGLGEALSWLIDPALCWKDLEWLRAQTELPIVLKGIVRPDDCVRAMRSGMQGVIVSNHGGRQLDGAPATADVLERCVQATKGERADGVVLVDGGIRRGVDVVRALALGADGTLIGRPMLWGLAVHGEAGVRRVLEIMHAETSQAMALAGCPDLRSITRDLVERAS